MRIYKIILIIAILLLGNLVYGAWNIDLNLEPSATKNSFLVLARINDSSGNYVNESCEQYTITYSYNGSTKGLNYFNGSGNLWYSLDNFINPGWVNISATGICNGIADSGIASKYLNGSEMDVKIITNFSEELPRGKKIMLKLNITKNNSLVVDPLINISYFFHSGKGIYSHGFLGIDDLNSNENLYEKNITLPLETGNYLFWVSVNDSNNSIGGTATEVNIAENLEGNLSLEGDYCNENVSECEPNAKINVNFTETIGNADNVTFYVEDSDGNVLFEKKMSNLTEDVWNSEFNVPENLTQIKIVVVAKNNITQFQTYKNVKISHFKINLITMKESFSSGEDLKIWVELLKPYSLLHLDENDVKFMNLSIINESDNEIAEYNLSDFTYKNGVFELTYRIPVDESPGRYYIKVNVENVVNVTENATKSYNVVKFQKSGPLEINVSLLDLNFNERGIFYQIMNYNNTDNNSVVVQTYAVGNISEILLGDVVFDEFDHSKSFLLPGKETKNVKIGFNISEFSNYYDGKIVVRTFTNLESTKEKFRAEIPVKVRILLVYANNSIGASPREFNLKIMDDGSYSENLKIYNLGNESSNISVTVEGDISNLIYPERNMVEIDPNNYEEITLNIFVDENVLSGNYTGDILLNNSIDVLRIPVNIEINRRYVVGSFKIEIIEDSNDLGKVIVGDSVRRKIRITNNGSVRLTNFRISSIDLSGIEIENLDKIELDPNESNDTYLVVTPDAEGEFNPKIRIDADPNAENYLEFKISAFENYSMKLENLRKDIKNLRDMAEQKGMNVSEIEDDLNDLENRIGEGLNLFAKSDYEGAKEMFISASSLKKKIENDIKNYNPAPENAPENPPGEEKKGGGKMIAIFIVIFVILLIIGVVIYLSIVPE